MPVCSHRHMLLNLLKICVPATTYPCIHDISVSHSPYNGSLPSINNFVEGIYSEEDICFLISCEKTETHDD